jgi:hypothetical protein
MFNHTQDNKSIDTILDECLERIVFGGESIEDCLAGYRQYAEELEPLLRTALAARQATMSIEPSPEFKARARYQFHAALNEMAAKQKQPRFGFRWRLNWAVAASLSLCLVLSTGGVVAAASNSMPDSPLYQVKLATEQIQLALTTSAEGKAELNAKLVDRRLDEIVNMAAAGNTELILSTTQRLDEHLSMIDSLPGNATAAEESGKFSMAPPYFSTRTVTKTVAPMAVPDKNPGETTVLGTSTTMIEAPVPTNPTGITTETNDGGSPPGGESDGGWRTQDDYQSLLAEMQLYSIDNIDELYAAIEATPDDDVRTALLQVLAVLENRALGEAVTTVTQTVTAE